VQHVPVHAQEHAREAVPVHARSRAARRRARGDPRPRAQADPAPARDARVTRARPLLLAVAALASLGACDRQCSAPPPPPPATEALAPGGFTTPKTTKQLVTAVVEGWSSTHARVALWQRTATGWQRTGDEWPAVIGKSGAAWGVGLHPAGRPGPVKREGDL